MRLERTKFGAIWAWCLLVGLFFLPGFARADVPTPVLSHLFPAGGAVGSTVRVSLEGTSLDEWTELFCSDSRVTSRKLDVKTAELTIPPDLPLGIYDLRVVGKFGVSGPRAFQVSDRVECSEVEPNEQPTTATPCELPAPWHAVWVNARMDKPGDIDCFRFSAKAQQSILIELWGERIGSPLRGVIEVFDPSGKRLAIGRGGTQIDSRVEFVTPVEGQYVVRVIDQSYLGGADYIYRLRLDAGPRVEFAIPHVVRRGETIESWVWGKNLTARDGLKVGDDALAEWDSLLREGWQVGRLHAPMATTGRFLAPRSSRQAGRAAITYQVPGCGVPLVLDLCDAPLITDGTQNHSPDHARQLAVPCEVSGQLLRGDERDWFVFSAKQGEVLWVEAMGARLESPLDLEIVVLADDQRELARFSDCPHDLGGMRFSTAHVDPEGRFVAPADGTYWLVIHDVLGAGNSGIASDPRRMYRLSIQRESPDFHVTLIPRRADQPTGINIPRGGRDYAEVIVQRRRGMSEPIRLSAENLPEGVRCPDSWVAAGESRGLVVLETQREARDWGRDVVWTATSHAGGKELRRLVEGGGMVKSGRPLPWTRMTQTTPVGLAPEVGLRVSAVVDEEKTFQGSICDVLVDVEREQGADGPIRLSAVGLPRGVANAYGTIPAGSSRGWLSLAISESQPVGPMTFAIEAELYAAQNSKQSRAVTCSNPVTLHVAAGRVHVRVEPGTPRKISRGQVIHVKYRAERQLGFIGKIHTELAAPGGVQGIRGRGVTFTGQTETGDIQIIATENAPLGPIPFLRLESIGTVEDQGVYRGACFLDLEIVE